MFPLRDSTPSKHFPLVTIMLIMINTFIFIYTLSLGMTGMQEVFYIFGLVPAYYAHPAGAPIGYFSFVTSVFLHAGRNSFWPAQLSPELLNLLTSFFPDYLSSYCD
jgi:membrane associated rhomboid family serine protease